MTPSRPLAFTLIELLIVVAIIAILAAIAVPNFLEAQTRSKVSRAISDQRTCANALESYRVDWARYPISQGFDQMERRWAQVTTPVAYITSIPDDVFGDDVRVSDWRIPSTSDPKFRVFDYLTFLDRDSGGITSTREHNVQYVQLLSRGYSPSIQWYISSQGPDLKVGLSYGPLDTAVTYDPTNGTISQGDIVRIGPGDQQL